MWADKNTYADFYAWRSSPAALAKAMLAARPEIELPGKLPGVVPPGVRAGGLRGVVPPGVRAGGLRGVVPRGCEPGGSGGSSPRA